MEIYLPLAEMTVPAEAVMALGTGVGFLSGMFGVGGGFLTTPLLIFMGVPSAIAVGTQANQLVASSLSGVLGHWRRGNVDIKMALVMLTGSVFGSLIGVFLFKLMQHVGQIDFIIPFLYVVILSLMGGSMFWDSIKGLIWKKGPQKRSKAFYKTSILRYMPYRMKFPRSRLYISALLPAGIGFIGGILVAVLGIGGGFLMVPAMIYVLGMPILLVAGTSLLQIMLSSIVTTIMHAMANQSVDLVLAAFLIVGGVIGAQFGVRVGKHVKGIYARLILSAIFILISVRLGMQLFIEPSSLYEIEVML